MKPKKLDEKLDVLFIGAHQDDIEATVGGTVALLADTGYNTEILDLSKRDGLYFQEEENRGKEAANAAELLGVERTVIDLGIRQIKNTPENRLEVVRFIRERRPDVVVTIYKDDSHPDHRATHYLVRDSVRESFVTAIKTESAPWRVKKIYYHFTPNILDIPKGVFLVDISQYFKIKMEALKCYASQFLFHSHNRKYELEYIKALNRYLGLLIKKDYAEILMSGIPQLHPFPELRET